MMKLIVAGDVCMRGQEDTMNADRARSILASVQPYLNSADLRVVNWENPTTDTPEEGAPIPKSGAMLHSKPGNIVFLEQGHFDIALMANNHTGDYGPTGTLATKKHLEAAGILTVGAGKNLTEARKPLYAVRNLERIAILSACEYEFGIAGYDTPGTAGYDAREMRANIANARNHADYVIVLFHGGNEYNPLPSPRCKSRYRDIIDMGADALVGMHSHCPQGYEIYNGKPIVYGTGNFMFRTLNPAITADHSWHYGYLVSLIFEKGKNPALELAPYQFDLDVNEIRLMEGSTKEKMLAYLKEISACFKNPLEHERMFMGWCMIAAPSYAKATKFDEHMLEAPDASPALELRNVFTCEAHNELLTTYMRMIVEHKLDIGRKYENAIRILQRMPVSIW